MVGANLRGPGPGNLRSVVAMVSGDLRVAAVRDWKPVPGAAPRHEAGRAGGPRGAPGSSGEPGMLVQVGPDPHRGHLPVASATLPVCPGRVELNKSNPILLQESTVFLHLRGEPHVHAENPSLHS